jgi:uncharacterized protein (TIGR03067 family)
MRQACVMVAMAALCGVALAAPGGDAQKDLQTLQGTWQIDTVQESDGKLGSDEKIKALTFAFNGDTLKLTTNGEPVVTYKVKVDPSKNPKAIDLTYQDGPEKGKTEPGIYQAEAGKLTLCLNDAGKERPTAFATKSGSKITLVVLKHAK